MAESSTSSMSIAEAGSPGLFYRQSNRFWRACTHDGFRGGRSVRSANDGSDDAIFDCDRKTNVDFGIGADGSAAPTGIHLFVLSQNAADQGNQKICDRDANLGWLAASEINFPRASRSAVMSTSQLRKKCGTALHA